MDKSEQKESLEEIKNNLIVQYGEEGSIFKCIVEKHQSLETMITYIHKFYSTIIKHDERLHFILAEENTKKQNLINYIYERIIARSELYTNNEDLIQDIKRKIEEHKEGV